MEGPKDYSGLAGLAVVLAVGMVVVLGGLLLLAFAYVVTQPVGGGALEHPNARFASSRCTPIGREVPRVALATPRITPAA